MRRIVASSLLLALAVLTPRDTAAQVYPERIIARERVRAIVAAYQQRRDGNNREEQVERTTRTLKLGADGVHVEVHSCPEKALSDGPQALLPPRYAELMDRMRKLADVMGKTF